MNPNERPAQCLFSARSFIPPPSCGFVGITSLMLVEVVATAVVISCGKYHDIHHVYTMYIYILYIIIKIRIIFIQILVTLISYIHLYNMYFGCWCGIWYRLILDSTCTMGATYTTEIWFLEWCHWPQIMSPWLGFPSSYGSLWWNGGATCTWHHVSKQFLVQLRRRHHPCPFQTATPSPHRWPFFWVGAMEHHQNEPWKRAGWVKIQNLGPRGPQIDWSIVSTISPLCKYVLIYIYIWILNVSCSLLFLLSWLSMAFYF